MAQFNSEREAKEYLIAKIVAEAEREGTPLSEIERKMLYFSETGWTLPGILEINAEFERDYDGDEYERKIAGLILNIEERYKTGDAQEIEAWYAADEKLSEGDHYLLVMLNSDFSPARGSTRPPGDLLKLWLTAFGILFGVFALGALLNALFGQKFWDALDWLFGHH